MTRQTFIPADGIPTPNVYFVTIQSAITGQTHSLYVAADYTGAVMGKLRRLCPELYGFRPYRSNCNIKMRRLRLKDYLETPHSITGAYSVALMLNEPDMAAAMHRRPQEVSDAIMDVANQRGVKINYDSTMERLADMLDEQERKTGGGK